MRIKEYSVYYDGKLQYNLNKKWLDKQDCWDNLEDIKDCHYLKLVIFSLIEETDDRELLKSLGQDLELIEFQLQKLWGFPLDKDYHMFWKYPKCRCPYLDNYDRYPNDYYIIGLDCPLHGSIDEEK